MKKSILFTFVLCLLSQWSVAQAPKWVEKAKRSVFSIVTYDKDDKIQNTVLKFICCLIPLRKAVT